MHEPSNPLEPTDDDVHSLAVLWSGPASKSAEPEQSQITGGRRFLQRVWRLAATPTGDIRRIRQGSMTGADDDIALATKRLIVQVIDDYTRVASHTAIARLMAFTNDLYLYVQSGDGAHGATLESSVDYLLLLLEPAVPRLSAELWMHRHPDTDIQDRIRNMLVPAADA